jgi:putative transposase
MSRRPGPANPFRYFKTSPEVIRRAVLIYVRFPRSLRNVEDLLFGSAPRRGREPCGAA